ncbi:MAG: AtpZ/AtpI family protein [Candidatus Sumerlaeaceae bacterium]|nr:AtpZ/AtpI family protein [Candidatus Sumerlaeaceae bacterium]
MPFFTVSDWGTLVRGVAVMARRRENGQGAKMAEGGSSKRSEERGQEARRISLGVTLPTTFAASVVVAVVIGYGLDRWLGTGPWLTLVFLGLGLIAGIREILSVLKKLDH